MENQTETIELNYKDKKNNITIYKSDNDYISKVIRLEKTFYEIQFLEHILNRYKYQHTILDIGANIGNHSLFFCKYFKCNRVISFEPMPDNIKLFKKNLEGEDKCQLYEFALSDKAETVSIFNTQKDNHGGYSISSTANGESFHVKDEISAIPLDLLKLENVTFIKIDVESYENNVLRGAEKTIKKWKPIVAVENNSHYFSNIHTNKEPHKEIFEKMGYKRVETNVCGYCMDIWAFDYSIN